MSKHTSGPWWNDGLRIEANHRRWPVALVKDMEDETEANARLIAAAPELLETLEAVLKHASLDPNHLHKFGADYQRAQAAIAKTLGE